MDSDENHIYVSDFNNHCISHWSLMKLGDVDNVADGRGNGNDLNQLSYPRGIYAARNYLYIADTGNDRIIRVDLNTLESIILIGMSSTSFYQYKLDRPTSIVSDRYDQILYIADRGCVLKWWSDS
ncbi:unnamed protein product [Rotaria sordida]|uniref:Uncharacterized protein n=1 Tax=Rotaria sordida TaxID=392033 RepID=A0A819XME7_9BILA|nr:unnamed protein product [Rotaria sordida]CAF4138934.1 unnamed protein product [Rotaria sordida]